MNEPADPTTVELYLQGGYVSGRTHQIGQRRRLVDVLNGQEAVFELESAQLTLASSDTIRVLPNIAVDKSSILAAVPHETREQLRQRAILNTGISRSRGTQTRIGLLLTPLYVEGTAHMATEASMLRTGVKTFPRFFPLTSTVLYVPDGEALELPVLLVNRDSVSAISPVAESMPNAAGFGL